MALSLFSNQTDRKTHKINKFHAELFGSFGSKIDSTNNNTTVTVTGTSLVDGWNTAYGALQFQPEKNKIYCWGFTIQQHHQKYSSICIGIEEVLKGSQQSGGYLDSYFHGQVKQRNYAFKSDGKKYSHSIPKGTKFSDRYNAGDRVLMLMDGYSLSFCKVTEEFCKQNKIHTMQEYLDYGRWVPMEKKIWHQNKTKYRMAVALYGRTTMFGDTVQDQSGVELVHFAEITKPEDQVQDDTDSDDEDDEEDEDAKSEHDYMPQPSAPGASGNDSKLKHALTSLEQQLSAFEGKYHRQMLANLYGECGLTALQVQDEMNALKVRLNSVQQHVEKMECFVASIMSPDTRQYETWSIPQMVQWICSLDNGAYSSYASVLRKGFESDRINDGQAMCLLSADDLRNKPFRITDFTARKKLQQHFQSLQQKQFYYQ